MGRRAQKRAFGSAIAIASVVAMTSCGSSDSQPNTEASTTQPAASQAPTPTASTVQPAASQPSTTNLTTTQEFVSERYAFAVTLPPDWYEADATQDWGGQFLAGPGSKDFANLTDLATHRTLMVAAATVPAGMQLADWQAAMVAGTAVGVCSESPSAETTTLGGEPALVWTADCSDGYDVNKLAALHGDRGYMMYMPSDSANDDGEDQRIFDEFRQSFRFTS